MAALVRISRAFQQTTCCMCSKVPAIHSGSQRSNSNRASISRIKKAHYVRTYPNLLVLPDGSSINIRYEKPRRILKLPVDVSTLTEQEQDRRTMIFNPPKKIQVKQEIEDNIDVSKYANLIKRKKK